MKRAIKHTAALLAVSALRFAHPNASGLNEQQTPIRGVQYQNQLNSILMLIFA